MPNAETINAYLQQVSQFKNRQADYNQYLKPEEREKLLVEVLTAIGFTPELNHLRKQRAEQVYHIYELLREDFWLRKASPENYQKYCQEYLRKALALDPFNEDLLKIYTNEEVSWKVEDIYKYRYLELLNPHSNKHQELTLAWNLDKTSEIDYLRKETINDLVRAMVELEEMATAPNDLEEVDDQATFKQIIEEAGVDKDTVEALEAILPEHLEIIWENTHSVFEGWDRILKAYLSVEKVLAIAPYRREVLLVATLFYVKVFPRILLGYHEYATINGIKGKSKHFFESVFQKAKLSNAERLEEAKKSFKKGMELKERYLEVINVLFYDKTKSSEHILSNYRDNFLEGGWVGLKGSFYYSVSTYFNTESHVKMMYQDLEKHLVYLEAYCEQEFLLFQIAKSLLSPNKMSAKKTLFGFLSISISLLIAIFVAITLSTYVVDSFISVGVGLFSFIILRTILNKRFSKIATKPQTKEPDLLPFRRDSLDKL